jgi:hypothetical protein
MHRLAPSVSLPASDQCNDRADRKDDQKRTGPDKLIYLKRMAEFDRLIEICTSRLLNNPDNDRALMIRASAFMKKGALPLSTLLQLHPVYGLGRAM